MSNSKDSKNSQPNSRSIASEMNAYSSNVWQSPNIDMTYQWNYGAPQSPKANVNQYNNVSVRTSKEICIH
jgi:hypothetical protein